MRDRRDGRAGGAARGARRGAGRDRTAGSSGPAYRLSGATGSRGRVPHVRLSGSGKSSLAGRTSPSTILVGRGDIPQFRDKAARNGGWSIPSLSGRPHAPAPGKFLLVAGVAAAILVALVVWGVSRCSA